MTELIQTIHGVLARYPQIELAFLFGSLAKGKARPDSDIDLAVQADKPLDVTTKMAIIGDLAAAFGRPVDLVDLRRVGEPLLGQILQGQRVLGSTTSHGRLLAKHLRDVADFLPYRDRILKYRRDKWINS